MFHYSLNENNQYVVVEYSEEGAVSEVLARVSHLERGEGGVPVRSAFLWFRARPRARPGIQPVAPPPPGLLHTHLSALASPHTHIAHHYLQHTLTAEDELKTLEEVSRLDEVGTRLRFLTARQVEMCLAGMFPRCRALPFGSSVNGLGRIGCDLDLYLDYDSSPVDAESRLVFQAKGGGGGGSGGGGGGAHWGRMQRQMEAIADLISIFLPGCTNVKRILRAKVPIVKFDHDMTAVQCDLSMSNMSGVYMSELVWLWGEVDSRVRPVVTWVKAWAEAAKLTHPDKTPGGWITNFSLTLMVVFYLQHVRVLPSVDALVSMARSEDMRFADEINCTFLRDASLVPPSPNTSSPVELLTGFFEFYSEFDFGTSGIAVTTGRSVVKPDHSALHVVNPLERTLNVARNVSPREVERLRVELRNAVWALEGSSPPILRTLLHPSDDSWSSRSDWHHQGSLRQGRAHRMVAVKDLFADHDTNH